jgi:hypothetical protein
MKKMIAIALMSSFSAMANTNVVPAPVKHLYIPDGFDSNDSVEVVVTGNFPSACFSRNEVKVSMKEDLIDIKITALSVEKVKQCPDMIVPFKEVISLGNLQGGEYKIRVNNKLQDMLLVTEASSSSVDDDLYAAIEYVERKSADEVVLHGWRYSNCIDLKEVKVVSNNKDTLSILPVMKQLSDFCPMKMMPTQYKVKMNFRTMKMKEPLLHVRTMDGKSINTIINREERK